MMTAARGRACVHRRRLLCAKLAGSRKKVWLKSSRLERDSLSRVSVSVCGPVHCHSRGALHHALHTRHVDWGSPVGSCMRTNEDEPTYSSSYATVLRYVDTRFTRPRFSHSRLRGRAGRRHVHDVLLRRTAGSIQLLASSAIARKSVSYAVPSLPTNIHHSERRGVGRSLTVQQRRKVKSSQ
jgi:hypothetical protein